MSEQRIGVGVIGASPEGGWAAFAHIPALAALPNLELRAVSTTRQESADAAARAFGATHAFDNHEDLVRCPDVDLVVVAVKVPQHREPVLAAIAAGKDVYCEWPLAVDEEEGRGLATAANEAGVRTVLGVQSRFEPAIRTVHDMIAADEIGEIISSTMVGQVNPGAAIDARNLYMADKASGANALTISAGHSMDAFCFCLGEFVQLHAVLDTRVPMFVDGNDTAVDKSAPDQIAVIGKLAGGAVASVHIREGLSGGGEFVWEINGSTGTLRLTGEHAHPGYYPMAVTLARAGNDIKKTLAIDPTYGAPEEAVAALLALKGTPPGNVARVYAQYAHDRLTGGRTVPDFNDAVVRHQMITAIEDSAYCDQ